jgi:hypothetical protein
LIATSIGTETPKQYLWEIEDTMPSLLEGAKQTVQRSTETKRVRLTAFSKTGCTVTQESSIDAIDLN